jgi:hypothetical protein
MLYLFHLHGGPFLAINIMGDNLAKKGSGDGITASSTLNIFTISHSTRRSTGNPWAATWAQVLPFI